MALLATLHDHRRSAERQALDVDATLRVEGRPLDALIVNISASGCLFICSEPLEVGDTATIGIAGIGRQGARVVRAVGTRFGAEFGIALTSAEIEAAVTASGGTVVSLPLPITGPLVDADEPPSARLAPTARLAIIVALATATWWALAAVLRALG